MTDTVIRAESLGKRYTLGRASSGKYRTLRESLSEAAQAPWRRWRGRMDSTESTDETEFWALRDVSFEIKQGEVVGIIGRNGAGKSTLLKVLSRITEPTTGRIALKGRVASLLEVGTGFHPELTGRENIFLNGAILGMHRSEIKAKFDEIVAFAEVEKFLDTPVKRYSSGMYVRLAFAVAAHLEPEVLIVDEVLAVGDTQFQKKCLGKMSEVAHGGRTVLFVSHNMAAVRGLCSRGLILANGSLILDSSINEAIKHYVSDGSIGDGKVEWKLDQRPQNSRIRLVGAYLLVDDYRQTAVAECSNPFSICLRYEVISPIPNLRIGFFMQNAAGVDVCGSNDEEQSHGVTVQPGIYTTKCNFPAYVLNAGRYLLYFGADAPSGEMQPLLTDYCLSFTMEDNVGHGPSHISLPGLVRPRLAWSTMEARELALESDP